MMRDRIPALRLLVAIDEPRVEHDQICQIAERKRSVDTGLPRRAILPDRHPLEERLHGRGAPRRLLALAADRGCDSRPRPARRCS